LELLLRFAFCSVFEVHQTFFSTCCPSDVIDLKTLFMQKEEFNILHHHVRVHHGCKNTKGEHRGNQGELIRFLDSMVRADKEESWHHALGIEEVWHPTLNQEEV